MPSFDSFRVFEWLHMGHGDAMKIGEFDLGKIAKSPWWGAIIFGLLYGANNAYVAAHKPVIPTPVPQPLSVPAPTIEPPPPVSL